MILQFLNTRKKLAAMRNMDALPLWVTQNVPALLMTTVGVYGTKNVEGQASASVLKGSSGKVAGPVLT